MKDKYKNYGVVAGVFAVLVLAGATAVFFTQGSIVPGTQKESIKFYQVTEDAGVEYDPSTDYPVLSDSAVLGEYRLNVVDKGKLENGNGCFIELQVSKNGEQVLNQRSVEGIAGTSDKSIDASNLEGLNIVGTTHYMQYDTWYGNGQIYVLSQTCGGGFLEYEMPVQFDKMDFSFSTENRTAGNNFTATLTVENNWKPLNINYTVEACSVTGFCGSRTISRDVPTGTSKIRMVLPAIEGELDVSTHGSVYLDLGAMPVSGLNVNKDGEYRKVSDVQHVKIAELKGSDTVTVVKVPASKNDEPGQKSKTQDGDISLWDKFLLLLESWFGEKPSGVSGQ